MDVKALRCFFNDFVGVGWHALLLSRVCVAYNVDGELLAESCCAVPIMVLKRYAGQCPENMTGQEGTKANERAGCRVIGRSPCLSHLTFLL